MFESHESMALLRQYLVEPPSWKGWIQLCSLFDQWPGADKALALEYALEHLESSWPAEVRKKHADYPSHAQINQWGQTHHRTITSLPNAREIWCPPGEFSMGAERSGPGMEVEDEAPVTQVTLTRPFWMQETPVTQEQWDTFFEDNPSNGGHGEKNPVESMTWFSALAFCNVLSRAEGLEEAYVFYITDDEVVSAEELEGIELEAGEGELAAIKVEWKGLDCEGYRLPTEAEWAWASRAGLSSIPEWTETRLKEFAWFDANSHDQSHPVAEKEPGQWGFYDMFGNVSEWCWDWFGLYPGGHVTDPMGADSGDFRVVRGGSWWDDFHDVTLTTRSNETPHEHDDGIGFRVVRTDTRGVLKKD